jgi:hypothetical protein
LYIPSFIISVIVNALERRFPATSGYGTLFPPGKYGKNADTGLIKAFAKFYGDNTLFPPATTLIPWDKLSPAFLADRGAVSNFMLKILSPQ